MKAYKILAWLVIGLLSLSVVVSCGESTSDDPETDGAANDDDDDNGGGIILQTGDGFDALSVMDGKQARSIFKTELKADSESCSANIGLAMADIQVIINLLNGLVDFARAFFPDIFQMTGFFEKQLQTDFAAAQVSIDYLIATFLRPILEPLAEIADSMAVVRQLNSENPNACRIYFDFPVDLSMLDFFGIETDYQYVTFGKEWDQSEANIMLAGSAGIVGLFDFIVAHDLTLANADFPAYGDFENYGKINWLMFARAFGEFAAANPRFLGKSRDNWSQIEDALGHLSMAARASADFLPDLEKETEETEMVPAPDDLIGPPADNTDNPDGETDEPLMIEVPVDAQNDEVFGLIDQDGNGLDAGDVIKIGLTGTFGIDGGDGFGLPLPKYIFEREAVLIMVELIEKLAKQLEAAEGGPAAEPLTFADANRLMDAMRMKNIEIYDAVKLDVGAYFVDPKPVREYLPPIYDNFECRLGECFGDHFLVEFEVGAYPNPASVDVFLFNEDSPHFSGEYINDDSPIEYIEPIPEDCVAPQDEEDYLPYVYLPDPSFNGMLSIDVGVFPLECSNDPTGFTSGNYSVNKLIAAYFSGYFFSDLPYRYDE